MAMIYDGENGGGKPPAFRRGDVAVLFLSAPTMARRGTPARCRVSGPRLAGERMLPLYFGWRRRYVRRLFACHLMSPQPLRGILKLAEATRLRVDGRVGLIAVPTREHHRPASGTGRRAPPSASCLHI